MEKQSKKPWIVLLVIGLQLTAAMGVGISTVGLFFTTVSEDLGVLRGTFAMHLTLMLLIGSLTAIFIPRIYKRFEFKKVLFTAITISVITTALMGLANHVAWFFILGAIRGISGSLLKMVTVSMIINKWFVKKHGLAISLAFAISGVGGAVFAPIFSNLIENIGWQYTYLVKALVYLMLCLPVLIYPFTMDPKEEGSFPYGYCKTTDKKEKVNENALTDNKDYTYTTFMVVMFILYSIPIMIVVAFAQHLPGFAESLGHSTAAGATLMSAALISNIVSKLLAGILSDILDPIKAALIMTSVNIVGIFVLLNFTDLEPLIVGAFLFGFAFSMGSTARLLLVKYFFGVENFTKVYPKISLVTGVIFSLCVAIIGYLYDFFESFNLALYVGLIGLLLGPIALFILKANRKTQLEVTCCKKEVVN